MVRKFYTEEDINRIEEKSDIFRSLSEEIQIFIETYDRDCKVEMELIESFTCILIHYQNNLNKDKYSFQTKYYNSNDHNGYKSSTFYKNVSNSKLTTREFLDILLNFLNELMRLETIIKNFKEDVIYKKIIITNILEMILSIILNDMKIILLKYIKLNK